MSIFRKINKRVALACLPAVLIVIGVVAYIGLPSSASAFEYQGVKYECSKNISGRLGMRGFQPIEQGEFNKFCRAFSSEFPGSGGCSETELGTVCVEYRAVLDILRRDDVHRMIDQYSPSKAWVKALGHNYINDKEYLKRILPSYSDMKIDCIIVVHSPEGTRFFIENGEKHDSHADHQYIEVSSTEFLASLNNAPDNDVNNFWLALH